jgi:predicted CoA-binding protein
LRSGDKTTVTLVLGASEEPSRYANMAVRLLRSYGYPVIAFGKRKGRIDETEIITLWDTSWQVDTVTLYINPAHQKEYYQRIVDLGPRRVIFNPGTENTVFIELLRDAGIVTEEACTLVLLRTGSYG